MMMMAAEIGDQKRRSLHDGFLLPNSAATTKRLKSEGSTISTKADDEQEKKDKIGERVTALQQLVSPFGKTDTASVLQEATGYIRFLHDQLQVLSAPYLRARVDSELQEEEYCSLSSRGLCLMPTAAALKIARSNGADLWAPAKASSSHP